MAKLTAISIMILVMVLSKVDASTKPPPNFIIILTDDQDIVLNGMIPMKFTQTLIAGAGKTYTNAFTSSPICCPSRSSLLTGKYAHNHRTTNNSESGGCYGENWRINMEPHALPVQLKEYYETFYAGKYLNEYFSNTVPPGWNYWYGLHGNSKYFNYTLNENGQNKFYANNYLTDVLKEHTINFLKNQTEKSKPFFAMISPPAAHAPFTPAKRHENKFLDIQLLKTPNFNIQSEVVQKHWLLTMPQPLSQQNINILQDINIRRWQTLLAVDELVKEIIDELQQQISNPNLIDNTFIIFTSDNGFHLGQFGQSADKRQPYETDIRVPFMIRGPGIQAKTLSDKPIMLIDLLPTILDLAELPILKNLTDGQSFKADLLNAIPELLLNMNIEENSTTTTGASDNERKILIEYWGEGNWDTWNSKCPWLKHDKLYGCVPDSNCHCQDAWNNTYNCIRQLTTTQDRLYCEFKDHDHFIEIYDLNEDPYQMDNLALSMLPSEQTMYSLALENLTKCFGDSCRHFMLNINN